MAGKPPLRVICGEALPGLAVALPEFEFLFYSGKSMECVIHSSKAENDWIPSGRVLAHHGLPEPSQEAKRRRKGHD
jgi:hypothetical protein